ncbi:MAG: ATP-dependent helicase HrpB [Candidatus Thiodiazotropha sp. (ex Gloverina cf. vestifex)]|nr:ATP-dependent helicase HrpB [Candidatus Thiodiazotropha sp. (ex Gloverina cf. vestifex)]
MSKLDACGLPIVEVLPELKAALQGSRSVVLSAPPGSGKTTIVPLALLDEQWVSGNKIIVLEPRRLAARAAAQRMAHIAGQQVGQTIGYRVRFDKRVSEETRIEVVTEGILTRQLQRDPELKGVSLIVFDEFHLRSIHSDLALALCTDVIAGLRDDLRLLVMSATLDIDAIASLIDAPVVTGEGRSYPVDIHYLGRPVEGFIPQIAASGILRALKQQQGDILAFLPGTGEIKATERLLNEPCGSRVEICPLYGDLTKEAQDRAIQPSKERKRRVVLATSIAETSLTIEGITTVVDSGWSRLPHFDPNSGLTRLETLRVSKASADQRAGRAGRLGPGVCYRLWTQSDQTKLAPHTPPEIIGADLAPLVLELANWGIKDPTDLNWLDAPPKGAYAQAQELLVRLDALDQKSLITSAGRRMVGLSLHPRLAHMLDYAEKSGQHALAADLAALLSERDILKRKRGDLPLPVDIDERLHLLQQWRKSRKELSKREGVDIGACLQVDKAARQWTRFKQQREREISLKPLSIGGLLGRAFPDRIAKRRGSGGFRLAAGRGASLPAGDRLESETFLVIPALDAGKKEGRVFLAASIPLEEIRSTHTKSITQKTSVTWVESTESVLAQEEEQLGAITLSSQRMTEISPEMQQCAMLDGIRRMGLKVLPWSRESKEWLQRIRCLKRWQPKEEWPDVSDLALLEGLDDWLAPWLEGMTRRDHLKRLDLKKILLTMLTWDKQRRMNELVPTHIQVPSGSFKRLDYSDEEAPVLAVKLQEMFGLVDTPRVCGGNKLIRVHLLSPSQRPIQITQDLRGFWERTYQEVKKELKGRYPKHYWPDDPWNAIASARVRPKK